MGNEWKKKTAEEIQEWLKFRRHGYVVPSKKGKGSYKRHPKYKNKQPTE